MINTQISDAAKVGDTEAVLELLGSEGIHTEDGQLALLWAATSGHAHTVLALLERGVNINAVGSRGHTALGSAAEEGQSAMMRLLLEKGAVLQDARVLVAAAGKDLETVRLLLELGADVNVTDGFGRTPLIQAAVKGKAEIVRLLLDHGADVHARDANGYMALRYATVRKNSDIVELLRAAGASE